MPIALLLLKPSAILPTPLAAAKALAPWAELLRVEAVLAERGRAAFLAGWFGRSVPLEGPYVRVAIANRAELDARLAAVAKAGSSTAAAPSVTNPIAALAGMISGALLSPAGQVAGISLLIRFGRFGRTTLVFAVAQLAGLIFLVKFSSAPGTATAVAFGGLAAAGAAGAVGALAAAREYVEGVLVTAASAARAMTATTRLAGLLTGSRSAVRNPLMRRILVLGDRLAGLAAQLLGAVAFVAAEVGPRLLSIARTVAGLRVAITTTGAALGAVLDSLAPVMLRLTKGDWAIGPHFTESAVTARHVVATVVDVVGRGIGLAVTTINSGADKIAIVVGDYLAEARRFVRRLFTDHPTGKTIADLIALTKDKSSTKPAQPGFLDVILPKVEIPDASKILQDLAVPPLPPLTWKAIEQQAAIPEPAGVARLRLELRARSAVAGLAQHPSIFEPQRKGLRERLAANRGQLTTLMSELTQLIGTYLTPALWSRHGPQLAEAVDKFAAFVYGDVAPAPPADDRLPVLRPDEPVPVRPEIRTLRLRAPGRSPGEVRAMRDTLIRRIQVQSYAVAAVTWGR